MRNIRSSRNSPSATISSRSRCVAQTTRTSTVNDSFSPTRRISPLSRNRSSLACIALGSSPISSRNSVPPSATSNRPDAVLVGPGEAAPLRWPNSSLSIRLSGKAPQLIATNGMIGPQALVVHGAGHQLLAGAGLAEDQHRRVRRRDLGDQRADLLHRRRCRRRAALEPSSRSSRRLRARYLFVSSRFSATRLSSAFQLDQLAGLGQVVERAVAQARPRPFPATTCRSARPRRCAGESSLALAITSMPDMPGMSRSTRMQS